MMKGTVRCKMIRGKRKPLCDHGGDCNNIAYAEVYPSLLGGKHKNKGWSYLCRNHLKQEQKRFKNKLPYYVI